MLLFIFTLNFVKLCSAFLDTMKGIFLLNKQAVGMRVHHYERHDLEVNGTHTAEIEVNNPFDSSAVSATASSQKIANLKGDSDIHYEIIGCQKPTS